jgi:hypothetical protein
LALYTACVEGLGDRIERLKILLSHLEHAFGKEISTFTQLLANWRRGSSHRVETSNIEMYRETNERLDGEFEAPDRSLHFVAASYSPSGSPHHHLIANRDMQLHLWVDVLAPYSEV